jgi:MoaA/NifB/PqqE/SkfB family radical SAM enzyme
MPHRPPTQAQPPDQLAVWEYAGLMITYWCNAKCAFCYVYSAPDRGGEMQVADAVQMWRGLDRLAASAGKSMRIHLAGGEPFGDWVQLASIVRAARDAGLTRLEKIETNAFWAVGDGLTRARLELLDALGMDMLVISADVYHQEFVPIERVQRCVEIARDVLGAGRVRVRWWDFYNQPVELRRRDDSEKRSAFAAALERHKDRLTGRAADRLAGFFERHAPEHFRHENCVRELLHSKHVHIDPYGNVFPGVCSGIILGNANKTSIPDLWQDLAVAWREHAVVGPVVEGGSFRLYERARELGYSPLPDGYAGKCHLCQHVRQYLLERGGWEQWVGPPEVYANALDKRETERWTAAQHVPLTVAGRGT